MIHEIYRDGFAVSMVLSNTLKDEILTVIDKHNLSDDFISDVIYPILKHNQSARMLFEAVNERLIEHDRKTFGRKFDYSKVHQN